jgi:predicted Zn-dependent protease
VLVLRATVRQSLHDFQGALEDLDRVVAVAPADAQAWITRSVVQTVLARYEDARASCRPLARLADELVATVCEASVDALTGSAAPAYSALERAIAGTHSSSAEESAWASSTLGEIAARLGRTDEAERAFRAALTAGPGDPYTTAAYADLLLDAGRPVDAARLVAGKTDNDNLLLRLVLAERAEGAREADAHTELLDGRYEAIRLRGDAVHRREEARFELAVHNPGAALALARANFDVQREPWDMRVLLEAAIVAQDPAAAAPALALLSASHLEDPRIAALAARVERDLR